MLSGDMGSYTRKHTGTADADTIASMQSQIINATMYYHLLIQDKDLMKNITLSSKRQAELLGVLFAEYEILTTEQASIVRQQMEKPSFFYNGGKDTLWAFYNHVTVALQQSHPRTWMEDQRMLHWFISNEFNLDAGNTISVQAITQTPTNLLAPVTVDPLTEIPNQTNILDQIAEIEAEEEVVIHIETDQEYLERVADIEGEPEVEMVDPKTEEELVTEYNLTHDDSKMNIEFLSPEEVVERYGDNVVQYTDPAGNTFEAPVVEAKAPQEFIDALMNAPEIEALEVDMSKVTWVDAPETVKEVEVAPERVKFAIDDAVEVEQEFALEETIEEDVFETPQPQQVGSDFDFDLGTDDTVADEDDFSVDFF
jgi:hypothetical protein